MNKKAEKFEAMLKTEKITAFTMREMGDDFHGSVYHSNLQIKGQQLPLMVILDDSIYAILRVFVAVKVVTAENKDKIAVYLNECNKKFKVFKYYISDDGDIVLDSCLVASDDAFDADMARTIIDVMLQHLEATYTDTMQCIWGSGSLAYV